MYSIAEDQSQQPIEFGNADLSIIFRPPGIERADQKVGKRRRKRCAKQPILPGDLSRKAEINRLDSDRAQLLVNLVAVCLRSDDAIDAPKQSIWSELLLYALHSQHLFGERDGPDMVGAIRAVRRRVFDNRRHPDPQLATEIERRLARHGAVEP